MRRATAALVAGSLLALGVPAAWALSDPEPRPGFGADAATALAAPATAPTPPASTDDGAGRVAAAPATRSVQLSAFDPPVAVRVGGLDAAVDAVGLAPDDEVVVPADVSRTGWYELGPAPGSAAGSAVIVGHVDDKEQGLGTFAVLPSVGAGDSVEVVQASGAVLSYEVVAMEVLAKQAVPLDRLFAVDGPPRLVLISCGGDFDAATSSYRDNVVVTAVPVAVP